jgi:hypothetical protein
VISDADAVAHPRTVVVHPQYALLAELAVVGSRRLHSLALLAEGCLLQLGDLSGTAWGRSYSEPYRFFLRYYRLIFCFCVF